jgi:hypothetical protein
VRQQLHKLRRIAMPDGLFIYTAHQHAMGDCRLLEQAPAGPGCGSEQQHDRGDALPMRMAAAIQVA